MVIFLKDIYLLNIASFRKIVLTNKFDQSLIFLLKFSLSVGDQYFDSNCSNIILH